MVEYQCSLILCKVSVGLGQSVVVDALTFLDDLEGSGDDGLIIAFQRIAQQVLQRLGVHFSGNSLFVR